ncbi:hypothetical protein XU18_1658 [Perkinsela sp. CCAP 1560/4]|nr:hypothetical protein XU18_1658 [Perkinsela sp. CCAP 1560/4]|eukprot:KNH07691.1 hypothetical protein XU18_1658 [Perkinsela sp. CCAP 1560/4]
MQMRSVNRHMETLLFLGGMRASSSSTSQVAKQTASGLELVVRDSQHKYFQMLHILSWFVLTSREKIRVSDFQERYSSILLPHHKALLEKEYGSLTNFFRHQGKFFVVEGAGKITSDEGALVHHRVPLAILRSMTNSMHLISKNNHRKVGILISELNSTVQKDVRSLMTQLGFHRLIDFLRKYFPLLLVDDKSPANAAILSAISDNTTVPISKNNVRTPHLATVLLIANQKDRLPEYAEVAFSFPSAGEKEGPKSSIMGIQTTTNQINLDKEREKAKVNQVLPEIVSKIFEMLPVNGDQMEFDGQIKPLLPIEWQSIPMLGRRIIGLNSPRISVENTRGRNYFCRALGNKKATRVSTASSHTISCLNKSRLQSTTGAKLYITQLPPRIIHSLIDSIVPELPADGSEVTMDDKIFSKITTNKDALVALGKKIFATNHTKIKCRYVGERVYVKLRTATDTEGYNQRRALDSFFIDTGIYPDTMRLPETTRRAFEALRDALPKNGSVMEMSYAQSLVPEHSHAWPQSVGKKLAMHPGIKVTFDATKSRYMVSRVEMAHEMIERSRNTDSLPQDNQSAQYSAINDLTSDFSGLNLDISDIFSRLWENVPTEWVRTSALLDQLRGASADFSSRTTFLRIALHVYDYFDFDIVPIPTKLQSPEDRREDYLRPFEIIIRRKEVDPPEFYKEYTLKRRPQSAESGEIKPVKQFEYNADLIIRLAVAMSGNFMPLTRALGQLPPKLLCDLNNMETAPDEVIPIYPQLFECSKTLAQNKDRTNRGRIPMSCLVRSVIHPQGEVAQITTGADDQENIRFLAGIISELGRVAGGCLVEDIPLALSKEESRRLPKQLDKFFLEKSEYFSLSDDSTMVSLLPGALEKLSANEDKEQEITYRVEDRKGNIKSITKKVVSIYSFQQPEFSATDEEVEEKSREWMAKNENIVSGIRKQIVKYKPLSKSAIAEFLHHTAYVMPKFKLRKRELERIRSVNSDTNKYNDELTLIKHIVDCLPAVGDVKVSTVIHKLMDSEAVQVLPPHLKDLFDYYADEISCRVDDAGMWLSRPTAKQGSKDEFQKAYRNAEYDYKNNPYKSSDTLLNPMDFPFPIPPPGDEGRVLVFGMPPFSLQGDDDLQFCLPKRLRYIGYSNVLKRYPLVVESQPSKKIRWPYITRHTDLEIPHEPGKQPAFSSVPFDVERKWVAQIVRLLPPTGKPRTIEEIRGRVQQDLRMYVTEDKEQVILEKYPELVRIEKTQYSNPQGRFEETKFRMRRSPRLVALAECRRNWALVMYALNAINVKYVIHLEATKTAEPTKDISISFGELLKDIPVTIKKCMNNDEIFDVISRCVFVSVKQPDTEEEEKNAPNTKNETEYQKKERRHFSKRLSLYYGFRRDSINAELKKKLYGGSEDATGQIALDEFEYEESGDLKKMAFENAFNVLRMLCGNDSTGKMMIEACSIGNILPSHCMRIIKSTYGGFLDFIRSYPNHFEIIKTRSDPPAYSIRVISQGARQKAKIT